MNTLKTPLAELELVAPDIERDAAVAVQWLSGDVGRNTLRLMGNPDSKIVAPTIEAEKQRIQEFIDLEKQQKQLTWMIRFQNKIIGAVWVELQPTDHLPAPAIHIMIGNPAARGRGIGKNTFDAVISYLKHTGKYDALYSRHLTHNEVAGKLLEKSGFADTGEPYQDQDGLEWQNARLELRDHITV